MINCIFLRMQSLSQSFAFESLQFTNWKIYRKYILLGVYQMYFYGLQGNWQNRDESFSVELWCIIVRRSIS